MDLSKFIYYLFLFIILILLPSLYLLNYNQQYQSYISRLSKKIETKNQRMPPILIWNKCSGKTKQTIGYPDYPVIDSGIKCPFNCTFTFDRKL
uniref:Uncharacterized protein n=1 Tax=Meloidogyne enterolobii TaxID=390850 RepID=A0A6V7UST2_MELEN|nr:unnamed protein product [Meloidogyne enterolobii]